MRHLNLFLIFLKFGLQAWGGPVAQIGMLRQELVEKEGWISPEKFNRVLAVYQALPGPEAHEMCVYMGMVKAGRVGAVLAGLGFMLPGVLLILALAWAYQNIGSALLVSLLIGFKPAVAALMVRAVHQIGRHALLHSSLFLCFTVSVILTLLEVPFALVFLLSGVMRALWVKSLRGTVWLLAGVSIAAAYVLSSHALGVAPIHMAKSDSLFVEGLKAGLLSFGGAYTAIPFLKESMVGTPGVTLEVVLDSIAIATLIPAPLISFATFLGFMAGGVQGALLITLGVFLPSFLFTLLGHRYLEKVIEYKALNAMLDGITAGVIGLLALSAAGILQHAVNDFASAVLFSAALIGFYCFKSAWSVPVVILLTGAAGHLLIKFF